MNELIQLINNLSGPVPHMTLFFTLACILGWWTQEAIATLKLMIIWSIFAECLQIFYPAIFQFSLIDIGWNLIGSAVGIVAVQIALFICSDWIQRTESWNEIRRDMRHGNYSR